VPFFLATSHLEVFCTPETQAQALIFRMSLVTQPLNQPNQEEPKMPEQADSIKTTRFLAAMSPVITETIKRILRSCGARVEEQGQGLETVLVIKSGEKQADFHLHNLLLEIATIDRDESPLRFDEGLRDPGYFLAKTDRLIKAKLNILIHFLSEENPESAIENIKKEANHYERIRIWKFDRKESN
jgi:hypothetical protein